MLRELRVRNVAVIESAVVPFGPGLNVLTGETGAGKSILLDALLLAAGARAQADAIRAGAETALVEAVFDLADAPGARAVVEEAGLAPEDGEVVVRRELARTGRHRAFVNDSPVTVALLERLGEHLVDVHGQHEHQRLLEPARQLDLLDRFADAEALRAEVAALHARLCAARDAVERLRAGARDRAQRLDLLRFQLAELDAARLRPGEDEELRAERRRLLHAEKLAGGLAAALALLQDDPDAAAARLARATRLLHDLGRLDPAFAGPAGPLEAAAVHVEEAVLALRALRGRVEVPPGRLEAIEERLDVLARLGRKYGDTVAAMCAFRDEAARELDRLERHGEVLDEAERALAALEAELDAAAARLGERRREAARRLAPRVERELRALGMPHARVEVALEPLPPGERSPRGQERVELRFAANPGEPCRPLARVASGGELSRTMLGLQVVLAAAERVPTMVFDEVDAGLGAGMAAVVADKLAAVAARRQVLCVTHLPQIAARADHHLVVTKDVRDGRARAVVRVLAGGARLEELARMLGGARPDAAARRHARALLAARRGA